MLVLAATLAHPNRNPSLTSLEGATGLRRTTISRAQQELEREQTVRYQRPTKRIDGTPIFAESNKAVWVEPATDPYKNKNAALFLPGPLARKLPRGTKNTALVALVAIAHAREQLIRGASQIEDDSLAAMFRTTTKRIGSAKRALKNADLLTFSHRTPPCDVLTFPGATPGRNPDPSELDPSRTYRLTEIECPWTRTPIGLRATQNQVAKLSHKMRDAGCLATTLAVGALASQAIDAAYPDDSHFDDFAYDPDQMILGEAYDYDENAAPARLPIGGGGLLDELNRIAENPPQLVALPNAETRQVSRSGHPTDPVEATVSTETPDPKNKDLYARSARESGWRESDASPSATPEPQVAHWPPGIAARAVELFGIKAARTGTDTHARLDKHISHALRVWAEKYAVDELSPAQTAVAAARLLAALDYLAALPTARDRFPAIGQAILRVVNDEETHARFTALPPPTTPAREGTVDVRDELAETLDSLA